MFSGIIEGRGELLSLSGGGDFRRVRVRKLPGWGTLGTGSSVAVNGACLTVTFEDGDSFAADLSFETLGRTGLAALSPGQQLNLERPVSLGDRLHGHLVTGHIDCTGLVRRVSGQGKVSELWIAPELEKNPLEFVVEKGSVAVNGVSLTVGLVREGEFQLVIIPQTLAVTGLGTLRPGDGVNLEFDLLAKYFRKWYLQDRGVGVKTSAIHYL